MSPSQSGLPFCLLFAFACSADVFVSGDGSTDAAPYDAGSGFCSKVTSVFCDDFDARTKLFLGAGQPWDTLTPAQNTEGKIQTSAVCFAGGCAEFSLAGPGAASSHNLRLIKQLQQLPAFTLSFRLRIDAWQVSNDSLITSLTVGPKAVIILSVQPTSRLLATLLQPGDAAPLTLATKDIVQLGASTWNEVNVSVKAGAQTITIKVGATTVTLGAGDGVSLPATMYPTLEMGYGYYGAYQSATYQLDEVLVTSP